MYFYEKPLDTLTEDEWEQICMRCGKCCAYKYTDGITLYLSNRMCKFFDLKTGLCSCYDQRFKTFGSDCQRVCMELLKTNLSMLPPSCAYRRLYEGKGLPPYHPLITGDPNSVIRAKQTVAFLPVVSEKDREDTIAEIIGKGYNEGLSDDEIKEKLTKALEKFELKWLETYPDVSGSAV